MCAGGIFFFLAVKNESKYAPNFLLEGTISFHNENYLHRETKETIMETVFLQQYSLFFWEAVTGNYLRLVVNRYAWSSRSGYYTIILGAKVPRAD